MFFNQECTGFYILDVLKLDQKNVSIYNSERNFSALSFRFDSNTFFEYDGQMLDVNDCICYVPQGIAYKRVSEYDKLIVIHFNSLTYHSKDIEFFIPQDREKFASLFEKAWECFDSRQSGYKMRASAILCEILAEIYKEQQRNEQLPSIISAAVEYIEKNLFSKNISIKDAALASHISESHLRKVFKDLFGMPPKKYILGRRINYAISLLESGYYSVKEIAFKVGFSDVKYFSTEFKRLTGHSPSEYKYNQYE